MGMGMGMKRGSKPGIDIRRSEDIHNISVIPPLPDTPHSSRSSLCSCENGAGHPSPRSPPRRPDRSPQRSPLLCPTQLETKHDRAASRPSSPNLFLDQSYLSSPSPLDEQDEITLEPPKFDQTETATASVEPKGDDERPESPERTTDNQAADPADKTSSEGEYSEDIQKLIRETDEAFKLRHSFSEAKLPPPLLSDIPEVPKLPKVERAPSMRKSTPTPLSRNKSQKRRSQSSTKSATKPHMKALAATPVRLTPASKIKRTKSKKARRRPRATSISTTPPVPKPSTRWTLTESAKDLFTIRIFHRIQADEMLPESTLQEIRMSRACHGGQQQPVKNGAETIERADTPIEPFRQEDPANQKGASDASLSVPATIEEEDDTSRSSTPDLSEIKYCDGCGPSRQEERSQQQQQNLSPCGGNREIVEKDTPLPIMKTTEDEQQQPSISNSAITLNTSPVRISPRRLPTRQLPLPPLPTIPEVIATGSEDSILSPTSVAPPHGASFRINKDDYVFLPSAPFTITVPIFQHAPIRLAKADLPIGKLAAAVDDTLDWTAFQMAILGGAGDFFSEPTDYSRPSDAELDERDDLVAWFATFGFNSAGALVTSSDEMQTPALSPSGRSESPSSLKSASPRSPGRHSPTPTPTSPDPNQTPTQATAHPQTPKTPTAATATEASPAPAKPVQYIGIEQMPRSRKDRARDFANRRFGHGRSDSGVQPWPMEAYPNHPRASDKMLARANSNGLNHAGLAIDSTRRPSIDSQRSLPQSPMLDLVVSRDVQGDEYVVPMGFNLGHDLGDFLKWEAEHVMAAGYYGSD
ncbi:hypothetical protein B0T17DRAFT_561262 [Bombardia bombarda]|uniref:Uncharacterized protein n=1 Tax=Bombardia bombarda TaxID=252184 RepID=A0AA39WML4_9PEZI|nr:hypothetical protein B0T17DRAFT_561262 [Bombardia bombarda]